MKLLEIPEGAANWIKREAAEKRETLLALKGITERDGAFYWNTNDRPVPSSYFREAFIEVPAAHAAAESAANEAFIAEYRKARKNVSPEALAEHRAEARAAHGPGVKLVNVFTGETLIT